MLAGRYQPLQVTIADGASKSGFVDTLGLRIVGVLVPTGAEQTRLRFFADVLGDDDTGAIVVNDAGEEINAVYATVAVPNVIAISAIGGTNRGPLPPASRYAVQSMSGVSTAAVQTGDLIVTLICEPLPTT